MQAAQADLSLSISLAGPLPNCFAPRPTPPCLASPRPHRHRGCGGMSPAGWDVATFIDCESASARRAPERPTPLRRPGAAPAAGVWAGLGRPGGFAGLLAHPRTALRKSSALLLGDSHSRRGAAAGPGGCCAEAGQHWAVTLSGHRGGLNFWRHFLRAGGHAGQDVQRARRLDKWRGAAWTDGDCIERARQGRTLAMQTCGRYAFLGESKVDTPSCCSRSSVCSTSTACSASAMR